MNSGPRRICFKYRSNPAWIDKAKNVEEKHSVYLSDFFEIARNSPIFSGNK